MQRGPDPRLLEESKATARPLGIDTFDVNQLSATRLSTRQTHGGEGHSKAVGQEAAQRIVRGAVDRWGREPYPQRAIM